MSKNTLSDIVSKKQASAEESAEREATQAMAGKASWEDENKDERISMRIEPGLKEAYRKQLPEFASITDAIRRHMVRVAEGKEEI